MSTIFEFIQKGNFMRVAAVDVKTGTEAIVVVPSDISQKEMESLAYKKLQYVMKKEGFK
jgi:hypothetical protein